MLKMSPEHGRRRCSRHQSRFLWPASRRA